MRGRKKSPDVPDRAAYIPEREEAEEKEEEERREREEGRLPGCAPIFLEKLAQKGISDNFSPKNQVKTKWTD